MTRKQQIMQATKELWLVEDDICEASTFQKGAEWADTHPNWHKYPDEKPTEDYKWFLTYCYDGSIIANQWGGKENGWCVFSDKNVIAWIEFPKLPNYREMAGIF